MRTRGKETQRSILVAAERVFAERGYAGARMDDVAATVGIKRASMVYYYRDKRTLYLGLLGDLFGGLLERYTMILGGPGSARERILACLDAWADHVIERPGLLRILLWEFARIQPTTAGPLAADVAPIFLALSEAIAAGQREGTFRAVDPLRFIMAVGGATAFLTLGMRVLASEAEPLGIEALRSELKAMAERMLFLD